jgi:acetyltransferase-like isoleucine patch superfamily enzyme
MEIQPRMAGRYVQRWRELHGRFGGLPSRLLLHAAFAKRQAAFKWPLHGNVLELLRDGRLELGRDVLLSEQAAVTGLPGARIILGDRTFLNRNVTIAASHLVEIGTQSAFGPGCYVSDHDHVPSEQDVAFGDTGRLVSRGPVIIGDHVWCGANVVVTSGVTIGDGCVIGANSVVTQDIPPHSVAVGAPARVVRTTRDAPGSTKEGSGLVTSARPQN